VSKTCREIAQHWSHKISEWELLIYGTSVKSMQDEEYDGALIRVEKSVIRIPVIGYKEMWLSIPIVELLKLFSSRKYSIIHSTTPGPIGVLGAVMARILRKPLVMTHHTRIVDYMNYYAPGIIRPLVIKLSVIIFRIFYSLGSLSIAHSPATVEELRYLKAKNIIYVPMGVDIPFPDLSLLLDERRKAGKLIRERLQIPENKKVVVYVGRLAKEKNLSLLGEVSNVLKHEFIIVGDGPVKKMLEKYPNLVLPGFKTGRDLVDFYLAADLFVCTSTSETLGKSLLEALSHGLPILVPDKGYHNSILEDESPVIHKFRWGKKEEVIANITEKIEELFSTDMDKQGIAEHALSYAKKFDWVKVIHEHVKPYSKIIKA
jgi:1,2-diacylglycerol 3-alpha-glucosyltransferase